MAFTLIRNEVGIYSLYVNGFHMPNFSVQRDYAKLQQWEDTGKLQIFDMMQMKTNDDVSDEDIKNAINELLKGIENERGSDLQ